MLRLFLNGRNGSMRLREAVDDFLADTQSRRLSPSTLRNYTQALTELAHILAPTSPVATISQADMRRARALIAKRDVKASTVHSYHRRWSAFWSYCEALGYVQVSPLHKLKPPRAGKHDPRVLTATEFRRFLAAVDNSRKLPPLVARDRALLLVLADTGLRRGEVVRLRLHHLRLEDSLLVVWGKGNKKRSAGLGQRARAALAEYLERWRWAAVKTDAVFLSQPGLPLKASTVYNLVRDYAGRARLTNVHPHTLRHTWATMFLADGGNLEELRIMLGHANLSTTQRYLHLVPYVERSLNGRSPVDRMYEL